MQKALGIIFILALVALVAFLGVKIWGLSQSEKSARLDSEELRRRVQTAQLEANQLKADLDYFGRTENLEKEMRGRFNYRAPDEKLMILVSHSGTSTTSTTTTSTKP